MVALATECRFVLVGFHRFALWSHLRKSRKETNDYLQDLGEWWARPDSNREPDRYERPALTIELQAQGILIPGLCQDENGADDGSRTRTGKPEGF